MWDTGDTGRLRGKKRDWYNYSLKSGCGRVGLQRRHGTGGALLVAWTADAVFQALHPKPKKLNIL